MNSKEGTPKSTGETILFSPRRERIVPSKQATSPPWSMPKEASHRKVAPLVEQRAVLLPRAMEFFRHCGIDAQWVNPVPIGEGLNHVVYAYDVPNDPKKVIKVPRMESKGLMNNGHEDERANIDTIQKYFGAYALKTEIRIDAKSGKYLLVQEAVSGKAVTNRTKTPEIRSQLADIMRLNREMMRQTGHSLDFVGLPGFFGWVRHQFRKIITKKSEFEISNLIVDDHGNIRIIDYDILRLREGNLGQKIFAHVGFVGNRLMMRWYFGVDIKPKE